MLSVSDDTVIREIKDGKMGAIKVRREYRIGESDYDAYIKAVKTSA
jgi:excisionase family DNA binding protein